MSERVSECVRTCARVCMCVLCVCVCVLCVNGCVHAHLYLCECVYARAFLYGERYHTTVRLHKTIRILFSRSYIHTHIHPPAPNVVAWTHARIRSRLNAHTDTHTHTHVRVCSTPLPAHAQTRTTPSPVPPIPSPPPTPLPPTPHTPTCRDKESIPARPQQPGGHTSLLLPVSPADRGRRPCRRCDVTAWHVRRVSGV